MSPASVTITIEDDDVAALSFRAPVTSTITEGDSGVANHNIIIEPEIGALQSDGTVSLSYAGDEDPATADATSGDDFIPTATLAAGAGAEPYTLAVPIVGDSFVEGDETFIINLEDPARSAPFRIGARPTATVTIEDNDQANLTVTPSQASAVINDSIEIVGTLDAFTVVGTGGSLSFADSTNSLTLTFTDTTDVAGTGAPDGFLSNQELRATAPYNTPDSPQTVEFSFAASSLPAGLTQDELATGSITAPATTELIVTRVALIPAQGVQFAADSVTVSDDEGDSGITNIAVKLVASDPPSSNIEIPIVIERDSDSATADASPSDYVVAALVYPASVTEAIGNVQVVADTIVETNEVFTVTLQPGSGAEYTLENGGRLTSTVTINDDDTAGFSIETPKPWASSAEDLEFIARLDSPVQVNAHGSTTGTITATEGGDGTSDAIVFTDSTGPGGQGDPDGLLTDSELASTVTWTAPTVTTATTASVSYTIAAFPTSAGGLTRLTNNAAEFDIETLTTDPTLPVVAPALSRLRVTEGQRARVKYTISPAPTGPLTIPVTFESDGVGTTNDATSGTDFTPTASINVLAGDTEATFSFPTTPDTTPEGSEVIRLTIADGGGTAGSVTGFNAGAAASIDVTITDTDTLIAAEDVGKPQIQFAAASVAVSHMEPDTDDTVTLTVETPELEQQETIIIVIADDIDPATTDATVDGDDVDNPDYALPDPDADAADNLITHTDAQSNDFLAVTLPTGTETHTFTVPVKADTLVEGDENFSVTLMAVGNRYIVGTRSVATVTINDNDQALLTVTAPAEGNIGEAVDISATLDTDIQIGTGVLEFADSAENIELTFIDTDGDGLITGSELTVDASAWTPTGAARTVSLSFSAATFPGSLTAAQFNTGTTTTPVTASITLAIPVTTMALSPTAVEVLEGDSATFTVTLSSPATTTIRGRYTLSPLASADGGGRPSRPTPGSDYTNPQASARTFTFNVGDETKTFSVATIADNVEDIASAIPASTGHPMERVGVEITSLTAATSVPDGMDEAILIIHDADIFSAGSIVERQYEFAASDGTPRNWAVVHPYEIPDPSGSATSVDTTLTIRTNIVAPSTGTTFSLAPDFTGIPSAEQAIAGTDFTLPASVTIPAGFDRADFTVTITPGSATQTKRFFITASAQRINPVSEETGALEVVINAPTTSSTAAVAFYPAQVDVEQNQNVVFSVINLADRDDPADTLTVPAGSDPLPDGINLHFNTVVEKTDADGDETPDRTGGTDLFQVPVPEDGKSIPILITTNTDAPAGITLLSESTSGVGNSFVDADGDTITSENSVSVNVTTPPRVSVNPTLSVLEGANGILDIFLNRAASGDVSGTVTYAAGTALAAGDDADFNIPRDLTWTIDQGNLSTSHEVQVPVDDLAEDAETFTITIALDENQPAVLGTLTETTVTIPASGVEYTFVDSPGTDPSDEATEGRVRNWPYADPYEITGGSQDITIEINTPLSTDQVFELDYGTTDIPAADLAPESAATIPGNLTIAAGATSGTATVTVDTSALTGAKRFLVIATPPPGYQLRNFFDQNLFEDRSSGRDRVEFSINNDAAAAADDIAFSPSTVEVQRGARTGSFVLRGETVISVINLPGSSGGRTDPSGTVTSSTNLPAGVTLYHGDNADALRTYDPDFGAGTRTNPRGTADVAAGQPFSFPAPADGESERILISVGDSATPGTYTFGNFTDSNNAAVTAVDDFTLEIPIVQLGLGIRQGSNSIPVSEISVIEGQSVPLFAILNRVHSADVPFRVTVTHGTTTDADINFNPQSGQRVERGRTFESVQFRTNRDTEREGDETFTLNIAFRGGGASGVELGATASVKITVIDQQSPPVFQFTDGVGGEPRTWPYINPYDLPDPVAPAEVVTQQVVLTLSKSDPDLDQIFLLAADDPGIAEEDFALPTGYSFPPRLIVPAGTTSAAA
ncbi:MAG: hypothetical protein MPK62_03050, partial [Alphaproteobacteria bacterium]|nr:hypothetical protein [Alphaproteobacteria bacterium]